MEITKLEGGVELADFTAKEKEDAEKVFDSLDNLLESIRNEEQALAANFIQLGMTLLDIQENKYWLMFDYHSFNEFISGVGEQINKGRTQIYYYIGIAERLLPIIPEQKLLTMGVTKAIHLASYVKDMGSAPPEELVNKALDPSVGVPEIKAEVMALTKKLPEDKGKYYDFGGFFVTADEKEEIDRFINVASQTDPPLNNLPEYALRKEIFFRAAREYLATYEHLVEQGKA